MLQDVQSGTNGVYKENTKKRGLLSHLLGGIKDDPMNTFPGLLVEMTHEELLEALLHQVLILTLKLGFVMGCIYSFCNVF